MKTKVSKFHLGFFGIPTYILCLFVVLLMSACSNPSEKEISYHPLSDSLATKNTIDLYVQMKRLASEYIMIGHQDALAYGMGWKGGDFESDIHKVSGDYPAVFGWDLGHIGETHNIDSVSFSDMKEWVRKSYKRGGINSFSWHCKNIATGGNSWDTSAGISEILTSGKNNKEYLEKLDLIADFFADLKDENGDAIPVLFRPWHEMDGSWFWWGSKNSTEEYKELWQLTYNYLNKDRDLHNIIYVYSSDMFDTREEYLKYYPGDEYVDILGYDDYWGLHDSTSVHKTVNMLEILSDLSIEKNKIYTISEGGVETIPDAKWFTELVLPTLTKNEKTLGVSYFLLWRNGRPDHYYAPYPGQGSANDFNTFVNDSHILLLNKLNNVREVEK